MNYRITVAPEARADLFRLNAFLAGQSDAAARRAMDGPWGAMSPGDRKRLLIYIFGFSTAHASGKGDCSIMHFGL